MIIVSYDISNTKVRTRFSKYLLKFGYRIQYSVFQINNSERILHNIKIEIHEKYKPMFTESDSIIVYHMSKQCHIDRYGYAKHDETDLLIVD